MTYNEWTQQIAAFQQWKHSLEEDNSEAIQSTGKMLMQMIDTELTEKQRTYILKYFVEGLNIVEISKLYGINKTTVSRTIHRGLQRLYKIARWNSNSLLAASIDNIKLKRGKYHRKKVRRN